MKRIPVNPGSIEWSGENPGIYLKSETSDNYSTLALFFRIVLSPHGRGIGAIILGEPEADDGFPNVPNLCITNNRSMMEYLIEGFVSKFPTFVGKLGLKGMSWHDVVTASRNNKTLPYSYSEELFSESVRIQLIWKHLQTPMAVEVGPDSSATKLHDMYAVFLEAGDAAISINDKKLNGNVADRQFFGKKMSTAFLAFSETWVTPK